jgi:hypothetical protein
MKRLVMELGLPAAVLFFSICAYGAIGDTIWTRFYGGYNSDAPVAVLPNSDGGFIIAGWSHSLEMGDIDYYLIKTDGNGDTLWTRTYGTPNNDVATSAALTRDGGIIIAGTTPILDRERISILLKSIGRETWNGNVPMAARRRIRSDVLPPTRDKGYILCGSTNSFGGSGFDVYVIKLDSVGDTVWTHRSGGIANDGGAAICQTADDNYLLTGWTTSDDNHNILYRKNKPNRQHNLVLGILRRNRLPGIVDCKYSRQQCRDQRLRL